MISCKFEDGRVVDNLRHVVVDTVLLDGDEIILVRRSDKVTEPGKLALPGGFLEKDERVIEGAAREILEETGYTVKNMRPIALIDSPDRGEDRQNVSFVFVAEVDKKAQEIDDETTELVRIKPSKLDSIKDQIAFDHAKMINIYIKSLK